MVYSLPDGDILCWDGLLLSHLKRVRLFLFFFFPISFVCNRRMGMGNRYFHQHFRPLGHAEVLSKYQKTIDDKLTQKKVGIINYATLAIHGCCVQCETARRSIQEQEKEKKREFFFRGRSNSSSRSF